MFILSSIYEGLPNVLLEAMSLKKFIISSNCLTGPKEILANGRYGYLFNVGNYSQLANKIKKFSSHKKLLKNKTLLGFKSLDRFNYNKNCNEYFYTIIKHL